MKRKNKSGRAHEMKKFRDNIFITSKRRLENRGCRVVKEGVRKDENQAYKIK